MNKEIDNNPQDVNSDPYGKGWMIKVLISNLEEVNELLSVDAYKSLIGA